MPELAEKVSASLTTNRNCTVEISNISGTFCLINPRVYMESGFSQHPPQPTIRSTRTEVCTFTKDDNTATGAVGLLTYDLYHMQGGTCRNRMAILFSVPFDQNLYKNKLAVGVIELAKNCDKTLYNQMYEGKEQVDFVRTDTDGSGLEYKNDYLEVRATMSKNGKAILKVELYDRM